MVLIQPSDRDRIIRKSSFEFFKRLAPTLNANASHSQKESIHKVVRHEVEGSTHPLKIKICSVTDTDLNDKMFLIFSHSYLGIYKEFGKVW